MQRCLEREIQERFDYLIDLYTPLRQKVKHKLSKKQLNFNKPASLLESEFYTYDNTYQQLVNKYILVFNKK